MEDANRLILRTFPDGRLFKSYNRHQSCEKRGEIAEEREWKTEETDPCYF
jgi:hypothetical protein